MPLKPIEWSTLRRRLQFAIGLGLLAGLVEGAGLLLIQKIDWQQMTQLRPVAIEIIWISAFFDALLFLLVALFLSFGGLWFPVFQRWSLWIGATSFLVLLDWLLVTERLRRSGALVLAMGLAAVCVRWAGSREAQIQRAIDRALPALVGVALFAFAGIQGGRWLGEQNAVAALPLPDRDAPNVLLIVVDTLRADHLSAYGYARPTSPSLDRLAAQGVQFENAFATSSWTLPSHVSLLTGAYPAQHGAVRGSFDCRSPVLPEVLAQRGYRTAAFSANSRIFGRRQGVACGFSRFEDYFHSFSDTAARTLYGRHFEISVLKWLGYEQIPGRKSAEEVNAALLRWLDRDSARPFFAFLNYYEPHDPYLPPAPYGNRFAPGKNGGLINTFFLERFYPELTAEQLHSEVAAYDGAIAYVDQEIGRLMEALEHRGLARNTLIVVTSDHGESFGEHRLLHHSGSLYRDQIQVPLIAVLPGRIPAGRRIGTPVSIADVPATILALAGRPALPLAGQPLSALWSDPSATKDWPFPIAEIERMPYELVRRSPNYSGKLWAVVTPEWHFILHEKDGPELYHRTRDPQEKINLAHTAEAGAVVQQMLAYLEQKTGKALPR